VTCVKLDASARQVIDLISLDIQFPISAMAQNRANISCAVRDEEPRRLHITGVLILRGLGE
jgi:hypothetical protein